MTFASDTVRLLFHQLPTERQVEFSDWEADIARRGRRLHIDAVMHEANVLEVCVRITSDYNGNAGTGDSRTIA